MFSPPKLPPLESNTLSHPSLSRFSLLMEVFFWYVSQLRPYGPLDVLNAFKMGPLDDPLRLGKKKNVTICPATTITPSRALPKSHYFSDTPRICNGISTYPPVREQRCRTFLSLKHSVVSNEFCQ